MFLSYFPVQETAEPVWQPRISLGMVKTRSVSVKNIHAHTLTYKSRRISVSRPVDPGSSVGTS